MSASAFRTSPSDAYPTERLARAIAKARNGLDNSWPMYLLAAAAALREMKAIRAGAASPKVETIFGQIDID